MGGKDKKAVDEVPCFNEIILKKFLVSYDNRSAEFNVRTSPDIISYVKQCLEDDVPMSKIIVRPIDRDLKAEDRLQKVLTMAEGSRDYEAMDELKSKLKAIKAPILLEPVMRVLNELQIKSCRTCIIVDVPLHYSDVVQLTNWVKLFQNKIKKVEIEDCCLQVDSIRKFSTCFNLQPSLTSICLDYNEFGDPGCIELCRGLQNNTTLTTLSLTYCNITHISGPYLGQILSTTALKELFLDGNDLRCHGVMDLIRVVANEAEKMHIQRALEKNLKMQEEAKLREEGIIEPVDDTKKKKKKGKGKKGKKVKEPLKIGPYVYKLHLADNGIDYYEEGSNKINSLRIVHDTMAMFVKLIEYSQEIEELDIHNNTIGNMSANLLVNALQMRQMKKVGSLAVRVSEKIEPDLFQRIMKLSKKVKKKKGKGRKKK